MSGEERFKIAKTYIDQQIAKMKKRGSVIKKISNQKYNALVKQAARAVKV